MAHDHKYQNRILQSCLRYDGRPRDPPEAPESSRNIVTYCGLRSRNQAENLAWPKMQKKKKRATTKEEERRRRRRKKKKKRRRRRRRRRMDRC